ncbi:double-strand break repair helicase AddA [Acuticoccus sp. I52.16.1]|uniref:double-strand break repair helicase AddA n=1 Tax=Acuticoccus sp. I52.16.1 TaxID=2928472 RepID=UPI001FD1F810|nr:double-strand break repair helicase AddA [Acuticoccus sp. I52.16.1]UOM35945.1 double-strand break repair helicase AddA [Acuticoccus sp. I52.16.1]
MSLRVPPEADDAQRRSSDPAASVWVSANAGAGKTYVLSQRVVRLLLSGVAPRTILCLTYTNAAAAEMAQRVYNALAVLAALPDDRLAAHVAKLAPDADPDAAALRARTLFAEALETPGGLKVQTIHAFAAALLRRFPLEANISGSFQVLDDPMREELTDRAIATVLARATLDPGGPVGDLVDAILPHISDFGLAASLKAALGERRRLIRWLGMGASTERLTESLGGALAPPQPGPPLGDDVCRRLADALRTAGVGKASLERIEAALGCPADERDARWAEIFLTAAGEPRKLGGIVPKKVLDGWPELETLVAAEHARLDAVADAERAAASIAATVPLMQLAFMVEEELTAAKRRRGVIDYDEQIETAMNLVRSGTAAAWVRYKLDEGIDHVMVDEAQDTSPPQWQLVEALTGEFFAGQGAKDVHRTLFVVGDEKQSIYSFQGAAPQLFGEKRGHYREAATEAGLTFRAVDLAHSMRSAPQVLSAVDRVFADGPLAASVGAGAGAVRHVAVKDGPGGVDLWPLFYDEEDEKPEAWDAPFDQAPENAGVVKLVRAIADAIEDWTDPRGTGPGGAPPVKPGDIMILTRKRGSFVGLMNRELKLRHIPTAGADRLTITDHIAVQDMVALARALISRDDLSLATVLKSPLFGLSEEALFTVAHGRDGSLMAALAETADPATRAAHATLARWRGMARTLRPFDFFSAVLVGEGRRADFAARLGSEAEDALDAFLDEALAFEGRDVPTLETFLMRLSKTKAELRRVADGTQNAVRVMTAHGSKGLEAKVVFLADVGAQATNPSRSPVVAVPSPAPGYEDVLVYAPSKPYQSAAVRAVLAEKSAAELAEHYRLLYVAMTRAEQHLVVCGAYGKKKPAEGMWHEVVQAALGADAATATMPSGEGLAWRNPAPGTPPEPEAPRPETPPPPRPAWLTAPATIAHAAPEPLVPSAAEHLAAVGDIAVERRPLDAVSFGTILHRLLERDEPVEAMLARIAEAHPRLAPEDAAAIAREAKAVHALPALSGPARHEVDVMGDVTVDGAVRRASGRIDRLQLSPGAVLIVDYKTDRIVPRRPADAPLAYRRQLAIYAALVRQMLPDRAVSTAIVWTASATMMEMDGVLPAVGMAPTA